MQLMGVKEATCNGLSSARQDDSPALLLLYGKERVLRHRLAFVNILHRLVHEAFDMRRWHTVRLELTRRK